MQDASEISLQAIRGWGGWSLFFLAVVWWIRGAPDRKRAATEGEIALQRSYGEYIDRLALRIDKMEREHEADRNSWLLERAALRAEHEADRRRHDEEREQWRRERQQLLDHVDGLERKLQSYGSSSLHLHTDGVDAPKTIARLVPDPPPVKRRRGPQQ
jgi:hypothetical protein